MGLAAVFQASARFDERRMVSFPAGPPERNRPPPAWDQAAVRGRGLRCIGPQGDRTLPWQQRGDRVMQAAEMLDVCGGITWRRDGR